MLHPNDTEYFEKLRKIGKLVALAHNIDVAVIEPKRAPGRGATGLAYCREKRISIEVRNKQPMSNGGAWSRGRYAHVNNLHTLGHELAHLLEFQTYGKTGHGARFKELETMLVNACNKLDCEESMAAL
jgi:hypothetical protein